MAGQHSGKSDTNRRKIGWFSSRCPSGCQRMATKPRSPTRS